jgi:hypothetical protein
MPLSQISNDGHYGPADEQTSAQSLLALLQLLKQPEVAGYLCTHVECRW